MNLTPLKVKSESRRALRIGEMLRHALSDILRRSSFADPDLLNLTVTVTKVQVSSDLSHATAFIASLGQQDVDTLLAALRRATPLLRRRIGRAVRLRFIPTLRFENDTAFDQAERILEILTQENNRHSIIER